MSIALSFDIGHSSIGWAVLKPNKEKSEILGCGTVVFPKEDCQNQQRAGFRRQRRHIAATRNRIKRLESFLIHTGALTPADVQYCRKHPHPWPWLLAAQVLGAKHKLSWKELWAVIRWYAHNRGYDGNALWAGEGSDPDDVKKVQAARKLMSDCQASSMCETICQLMTIDPKSTGNPEIKYYFKGENAAFPRDVVVAEVQRVMEQHIGILDGVSANLIKIFLEDWRSSKESGFNAKLPERYHGGLLFGQMKPRFENRIIPKCRITGEKTPSKHSRDFYCFRWAMLMGNLRVSDNVQGGSRSLSASEREQLNGIMEKAGYLNKTSLKKALEKDLGLEPTNLDAMLLVPEMEKALTLDPALREMNGKKYKKIWREIPKSWHSVFLNQLFNGKNYRSKPPSLGQWRNRIESKDELTDGLDKVLREAYETECKELSKKKQVEALPTYEVFLNRPLRIAQSHLASGRSPYSRVKLREAVEVIMRGEDPRAKEGVLEDTNEVLKQQKDALIDENTNNHLVRHRLKIFEKTLNDLVKHYADSDASQVKWVSVEVIRDLVEFSGKTAKEKARIIGEQLWHHRKVSKYLELEREAVGGTWEITAGLIKKVRIADDMGWKCPYTDKPYSLSQVLRGDVDREHIIPRSKRPTDALHALVLTFPDINRMKGARTAMQFIEDTKADGRTLTPKQFREFVGKLKKSNGPSKDDERRCTKRKIALLTRDYEPRGKAKEKATDESVDGFTEGSLTQTSYLNKLAVRQTQSWFAKKLSKNKKLPQVKQLSGSVTAATRRSWDIFGSLEAVHPEVCGKNKTEIREITHLHHALDAIVIGLSVEYFPQDGRLRSLLSKRSVQNPVDQEYMKTRLSGRISFSGKGEWKIEPLSNSIKTQIVKCLKEKRVVRHNPKTMRGLRIQQNVWRIEGEDPDDSSKMLIHMKPRNEDGVKIPKQKSERKTKLFGSRPSGIKGKLKQLKGALIVEDNYGVALDPEPRVIPYQQVWKQIEGLKRQNGEKPVRILRNGDVVRVQSGKYSGVWRIHSIKDANMGLVLDIASPEIVKAGNGIVGAKMNVLLKTLIRDGLELLSLDYSFHEE